MESIFYLRVDVFNNPLDEVLKFARHTRGCASRRKIEAQPEDDCEQHRKENAVVVQARKVKQLAAFLIRKVAQVVNDIFVDACGCFGGHSQFKLFAIRLRKSNKQTMSRRR